MIRAVIYDLDDLMVNSHLLHVEASERVFKKYKISQKSLPEHIRSGFIGMRVSDILRELIKIYNLKVNFEKVYKEREKILLDLVGEKLRPMPGLFESLKLLKKSAIAIAIASSGTKKYIKTVLLKFNISGYFDVIVSGDDVKLGKPNPETYIVTCKKLGLKPEEVLVLEDATKGIKAAKLAKCKCIAVSSKYTPKQDLSEADFEIKSLRDLNLNLINF